MQKFYFKVEIVGYGDNTQEAWENAVEALKDDPQSAPDPHLTMDDDRPPGDDAADSGKYVANFDPQAWVNDHAVSIDPGGPQKWDCSKELGRLAEAGHVDLAKIDAEIEGTGSWLDNDDVLKDDPAAPKWVLDHSGLFTITVRHAE